MRQSDGWGSRAVGFAATLLAMGGIACPADATNVYNNASIVADGLGFQVGSTCNQTWAAAGTSTCDSSADADAQFIVATGTRGAAFSLTDTTLGGGGGLFSTIAAGQTDELTFNLTVNASSTHPVNWAQLSVVTNGGTLGSGGSLSVTETGLTGFSNSGSLSVTSVAGGSPIITDGTKLTSPFTISYDVKLVEGTGGTLKLNSVQSIFFPAPEPVSLGIFGVGLVGLGAARRARRKAARQPT
jgi:3D (Asp-Asp-Asp) domain-containing protein